MERERGGGRIRIYSVETGKLLVSFFFFNGLTQNQSRYSMQSLTALNHKIAWDLGDNLMQYFPS